MYKELALPKNANSQSILNVIQLSPRKLDGDGKAVLLF
ncbi:hypothetical protein HNR53_002611 [Bacillus benzoevorans]|uniref:Uncharacterized protein n=1 Tax=Bacillus benzoevorans TaxID=1456 RepID=A0A7X0LWY2_9BACI|nr:hypothetical protein [Bacillus benzoevorans]